MIIISVFSSTKNTITKISIGLNKLQQNNLKVSLHNQYHRLTLPPFRIKILPHLRHTISIDFRPQTLSLFDFAWKGSIQPHFLHLILIILDSPA